MKHYLYYVGMKYKYKGSCKWKYVQTHIIATKENIENSIKMIIRYCMDDDLECKLKECKYFKIKEASEEEIERSINNENFLRFPDGTKICTIPRHLLLYELGGKY